MDARREVGVSAAETLRRLGAAVPCANCRQVVVLDSDCWTLRGLALDNRKEIFCSRACALTYVTLGGTRPDGTYEVGGQWRDDAWVDGAGYPFLPARYGEDLPADSWD